MPINQKICKKWTDSIAAKESRRYKKPKYINNGNIESDIKVLKVKTRTGWIC